MNTIGRYIIKGELGRGGMATVYRAFDPRLKREVAIKILPRELLHDPQFQKRFEREAETVATLSHPAIIPIYDFNEEDGQLYLVMSLMDSSLKELLANGALPTSEIARIFGHLAPGLDNAHRQGVIHRDLKPANILFDHHDPPLPYVADFGIAKLVENSETALSRSGLIIGTPEYMSPEQLQGKTDIDGRSDIYSMGIILYEMLNGRPPHQGANAFSIGLKHLNEPVPPLEKKGDTSPTWQAILDKALAKDPDDRYPTAQALADVVADQARRDKRVETVTFASEVKLDASLESDAEMPEGLAKMPDAGSDEALASPSAKLEESTVGLASESIEQKHAETATQKTVIDEVGPSTFTGETILETLPEPQKAVAENKGTGSLKKRQLPLWIAGVTVILLLVAGLFWFIGFMGDGGQPMDVIVNEKTPLPVYQEYITPVDVGERQQLTDVPGELLDCGNFAVNPFMPTITLSFFKFEPDDRIRVSYKDVSGVEYVLMNNQSTPDSGFEVADYTVAGANERYVLANPYPGIWNMAAEDCQGLIVDYKQRIRTMEIRGFPRILPQFKDPPYFDPNSDKHILRFQLIEEETGKLFTMADHPQFAINASATITGPDYEDEIAFTYQPNEGAVIIPVNGLDNRNHDIEIEVPAHTFVAQKPILTEQSGEYSIEIMATSFRHVGDPHVESDDLATVFDQEFTLFEDTYTLLVEPTADFDSNQLTPVDNLD